MKFKLKNTPEQCELIKATASRDKTIARDAQVALAQLLAPIIDQVLPVVDTTQAFYEEFRYDEDTDPSFPVEPLLYEGQEMLSVWRQDRPGGLPSNYVTAPTSEIKFSTYKLYSAINYDNKFARKSRLDVISKYFERLMETVILKTNRQAWIGILTVLANTSYNGVPNVRRAITAGRFTLDDLSKLMTRIKRQNMSWAGGSTSDSRGKLTDIWISPEVMEQIRDFAYQPINTKVANKIQPAGGDGDAAGVVTLPDAERAKFFSDADTQSIFNVNIHEMNEFGVNQLYNGLFDQVAGATTYAKPDGSGAAAFASTDELVFCADMTRTGAIRALSQDPDSKQAFQLSSDDQFFGRENKQGYWAELEEGRVCINGRLWAGLVL